MNGIALAESGRVPDFLIRIGIRRMLARRLAALEGPDPASRRAVERAWLETLRHSPVAPVPDLANRQHYEVEPAFFERVLGPRLKYSCALWPAGVETLAEAEEQMLATTCERAGVADGMRVLDLGCGWGSLSLWIAERHPHARVHAVSNSKLQREFIAGRARERGLANVDVTTADMNQFDSELRFDRIVSVEMFEHMRNWERLLSRVAGWLEPDGDAFVHVFSHREHAYPYEDRDESDWMARHFFSGGQMPSHDLMLRFEGDLVVGERWWLDGTHYQRTCEAWLRNLDAQRGAVREALARSYGAADAPTWLRRWRLFFLACAELFGYRRGGEWGVSHYRLVRP